MRPPFVLPLVLLPFLLLLLLLLLLHAPTLAHAAAIRDVVCSAEEGKVELPQYVNALCVWRGTLFAAGAFNRVGSLPRSAPNATPLWSSASSPRAESRGGGIYNFASYDPLKRRWRNESSLGSGNVSFTQALALSEAEQGDLYATGVALECRDKSEYLVVGGRFKNASNATANHVAFFSTRTREFLSLRVKGGGPLRLSSKGGGERWSANETGAGGGNDTAVTALRCEPSRRGGADALPGCGSLFVTGSFARLLGVPVNNLARLDLELSRDDVGVS